MLHLPAGRDFLDRDLRAGIRPVLSAMAQIQPRTHPGEVPGSLHADLFAVNRTHMAAVSLMGAAHAVVRQPPPEGDGAGDGASEHPYDEYHRLRAHNTYFVPYLLANLQRLVLHRFLDEAQDQLAGPGPAPSRPSRPTGPGGAAPPAAAEIGFLDLRRAVVKFGLNGELLEISDRAALQAYYRVARRASDVPRALRQLRGVISEWEGIHRAERLDETALSLRENVDKLEKIQGEVGWVELVFILVYVVQLAQILGQGFGFTGSPWHGSSLAILSVLALIMAYHCGFFPGRKKDTTRRVPRVLAWLVGLIVFYLGWNALMSPRAGSPSKPTRRPRRPPPRPRPPAAEAASPAPAPSTPRAGRTLTSQGPGRRTRAVRRRPTAPSATTAPTLETAPRRPLLRPRPSRRQGRTATVPRAGP